MRFRQSKRRGRNFQALPRFFGRWSRRQQALAAVFVVLVSGGLLVASWDRMFGSEPKPVHGPKLASLQPKTDQKVDEPAPPPPPTLPQLPPPPPPPPPAVDTNARGIAAGGILAGMNQAELDRYFADLKAVGAKWVRWDIAWTWVQPDGPGGYQWADTDRVVATAQKYGIQSLGIITYTPRWARLPQCADSMFCAPADPAAFGAFAGQVANRYKTKGIHHWEIWNEPNTEGFWSPAANVAGYTATLKAAYGAIKATDPAAVVVTGGLAPTATENGNIAPIAFVQGMYANGGRAAFDALGMHPYSYPVIPSYPAGWNAWQQMHVLRQVMTANGDGGKKIWATEFGAPTGGPGQLRITTQLEFTYPNDFMSEAAQLLIAEDAARLYGQDKAWLGGFFWYSLKDLGASRDTSENFFGVLRADGSKKPAYLVLQKIFSE